MIFRLKTNDFLLFMRKNKILHKKTTLCLYIIGGFSCFFTEVKQIHHSKFVYFPEKATKIVNKSLGLIDKSVPWWYIYTLPESNAWYDCIKLSKFET